MGDVVSHAGHDAEVIEIRRPLSGLSLDGFDAILVDASIHMAKYSRQLLDFVRCHKASLEAVPSGLFSVSLSAAGTEKQKPDGDRCLNEFLQQMNWSPIIKTTIAGGLAYLKCGLLKRLGREDNLQGRWRRHRHVQEPRVHGLDGRRSVRERVLVASSSVTGVTRDDDQVQ
jgi:hypothetical protein